MAMPRLLKAAATLLGLLMAVAAQPATAQENITTAGGMRMNNFDADAAPMIAAMEQHAVKMGVKGVIVVATMDSAGFSWVSRMKAVGANKVLADNPAKSEYPGWNFIGIAYSKAAEMADTKINSGSKIRPAYQGEFGYQGGVIKKVGNGYVLAVFSGGTSEQDLEIAKVGMSAMPENK